MFLQPGHRLAHYEILEPIGKGGMGEVYRARDTKLGRDVAIKVLPEEFARNKERLDRFEREARLLAQLNHANVATLHGLEEHDGQKFLVMELVDGETLAERIAQGPVLIDEAIPLFIQIAEGLKAAHEKGTIHRDLKPANIKVAPDGTPKILDFGLAKAFLDDRGESSDSSQSPTLTKGTALGTIMGTASYMSPEQARGKAVDKRTDIFAFGCVLYEVLTGRRAFSGETVTDTLAEVVKSDPDWSALPKETPAGLRKLLERCLRKNANHRLHDIADARIEIEDAAGEPVPASVAPARSRAGLSAAAVGVLLLGVVVGRGFVSSPGDADVRVTHAALSLPEGARFWMDNVSGVAISPDGTHVAYVASIGPTNHIYVQSLSEIKPRRIDIEQGGAFNPVQPSGGVMPFFSTDGRWLGFDGGADLKRVALSGGAPVVITSAAAWDNPRGASWAPNGSIVFAPDGTSGLVRVHADEGAVEILTEVNLDEKEKGHRFPHVLPGGEAVLFTIARSDIDTFDDAAIAVLSLDTGVYRVVIEGGSRPTYVDTGHVLYSRGSSLLAVPFDLETLSVRGAPVPVLDDLHTRPLFGASAYDVSRDGTLVYVSGEAHLAQNRLVWVDRGGGIEPLTREPAAYTWPHASPRGDQLAVMISGANDSLWIQDLDRETLSLLVRGFDNGAPLWTPDARRIVFHSNRTGIRGIYSTLADGPGDVDLLSRGQYQREPESFSPDGKTLVFTEIHPETSSDIWALDMTGAREPALLLATGADESNGRVSPDGRWLAYQSDESGQIEIYVMAFSGSGRRRQVSPDGGANPQWHPVGGELFYRRGTAMMAVAVTGDSELKIGAPRALFDIPQSPPGWNYTISPDGERFVMIIPEPRPEVTELRLVFNWTEELKRLVP